MSPAAASEEFVQAVRMARESEAARLQFRAAVYRSLQRIRAATSPAPSPVPSTPPTSQGDGGAQ